MRRARLDDGTADEHSIRSHIVRRHFVRLHMTLIVISSVAAGVLTSKGLLALGADSMLLRYPVNCVVAYLVFLFGVRMWLSYAGFDRGRKGVGSDLIDAVGDGGDVGFDLPRGGGGSGGFGGRGGGFGGGGASSSFEGGSARSGGLFSSFGGSGGEIGFDGDGFVAIVLVLLVVAAVVGAGGYVVYQAPSILADAAFQMLLAGGLVKRARRMGDADWAGSVFKATWLLLALILVVSLAFAYFAHHAYPQARTMGEVIQMARSGGAAQ